MGRSTLTAFVLGASLVLGGCASGDQPVSAEGYYGTQIKNEFEVSTRALTDTDGADFSLAAQTTKPVTLLFFGYTNCPDICGMVMSNIASALTRLDDSERDDVQVVFVTTDPARDDEAALRTYLDRYDESFTGLTGKLSTIEQVAKPLGVYLKRGRKLPSGGYEVTHDDHVFAINSADQVPLIWGQSTSAANMADDVKKLLKAAS